LSANKSLIAALQRSTTLDKSLQKKLMATATSVRMSTVSDALRDRSFRTAAWESLGMPKDTPFPSLPGELVYGDLSSEIHAPSIKEVYLSREKEDSDHSRFFLALADVLKKPVVFYSEAYAALGKDIT
jgi:hypothetical protein